ncbi:hypothetical protein V0R52_28465, partial [Pseudomonas asiatica]|uniref:hypothetical protein n=1 Tax=Pseudomonas asiatica TaxID=2219225 RepID=UPI002E7AE1D1
AGASTTAVWSGGEALVTVGGPLASTLNNWFYLDQIVGTNKRYTVSFDAAHVSGGSLEAGVGFGVGMTVTAAENGGVKKRYTYTASGGAGGTSRPCTFGGTAGAVWRIDNISVHELNGNHARQPTAAQRPMLRDTPRRIDYDGVDDSLAITFASSLGSSCTVARSIPGVGAQILAAQTIGTSFTDNVDSCGLIIVNRALTAAEAANLTRYLNQRAGV